MTAVSGIQSGMAGVGGAPLGSTAELVNFANGLPGLEGQLASLTTQFGGDPTAGLRNEDGSVGGLTSISLNNIFSPQEQAFFGLDEIGRITDSAEFIAQYGDVNNTSTRMMASDPSMHMMIAGLNNPDGPVLIDQKGQIAGSSGNGNSGNNGNGGGGSGNILIEAGKEVASDAVNQAVDAGVDAAKDYVSNVDWGSVGNGILSLFA